MVVDRPGQFGESLIFTGEPKQFNHLGQTFGAGHRRLQHQLPPGGKNGAGGTRIGRAQVPGIAQGPFKWNSALISLYARLTKAGKPHKLALVACARKLLIFANTVLTRQSPWQQNHPTYNGCSG
jgi:transposase